MQKISYFIIQKFKNTASAQLCGEGLKATLLRITFQLSDLISADDTHSHSVS